MITMNEMKKEFKFLNWMTVIKSGLTAFFEKKDQFNRLSMKSRTEPMEVGINYLNPACILKDMQSTAEALKMYHRTMEDITSACDDPQMGIDLIKKIIDAFSDESKCDNPDKVTALTMFNTDLLDKCSTNLFSLCVLTNLYDCPSVFHTQVERLFNRLVYALNSGLKAFGLEEISIDKEDRFTPPVSYTLNDHVVTYTQEELDEMARLEKEAEEAEQKRIECEQARAQVEAAAKTVLECYNRLKSSGNIVKMSLTPEAIRDLQELNDPAACDRVKGLYKLLMAMSSSVRYMPGEKASDEDRIMGSLMDLEKDVITYSAPFTVYTHEFGLSHNDIVRAIDMININNSSEHIQAQYVDTKQYIDKFINELPSVPKAVHIFKL